MGRAADFGWIVDGDEQDIHDWHPRSASKSYIRLHIQFPFSKLSATLSHSLTHVRIASQNRQFLGQSLHVPRSYKKPIVTILDDLRDAADSGGNDGQTCRQSL